MHFDLNRQDMHSHLLPGLDDGAKTMDDSLSLIRQLHSLGYTKLITTPHVMSGIWYNDADTILPALDALRAEVEKAGIGVELDAAAEYLMDDYFESLLEDKTPLLTINGKYLLVEFPFVALPVNYRSVFFNLKMAGYEPILAHPERYMYQHGDLDFYHDLQEAGVLLQVNILSLHGYYGTRVQKMALQLVNAGLVQFTGTDAHHQRHLDVLCRPLPDASVLTKLSGGVIKNELL
jgi:tyrosine-protein phosphatase YwqE